MDGAHLTRYPHLSWLGYLFEAPADAGKLGWRLNGRVHALHLVLAGHDRVRWTTRGRETTYRVKPGSFHYLPADGDLHAIAACPDGPVRSFTLFLPRRHLADVAAEDHLGDRVEFHRLLVHDDAVLHTCMTRLAMRSAMDDEDLECRKEEAARRLVLRLVQLNGGGTPDWHDDASVFPRRTLVNLVAYVDEHLRVAPSLGEMAGLVGMSPSHFARKFRRSTGVSLQRFVNRRRIERSFDLLRDNSFTLAEVSLRLGLSSQSHFAGLFSKLTGMTPARYRKQFRRASG